MRVVRCVPGAIGALLTVAAAVLLGAAPAAAGTGPAAPAGVQLVPAATSIAVRWNLPGAGVAGVVVIRTGWSADGAAASTTTLAPTRSVTLDGLVPGGRYVIGVAFTDGTATGAATVRRVTLSSAGLPTLVDQQPEVATADPTSVRSWDDATCAFYHYSPAVCGRAGTIFRTTGYTAATSDAWWSLSVATTREFGCLRHGTGEYRARITLSRRVEVDQYGYWEYEPVRIAADGTSTNGSDHRFTNPQSWLGADEMPHYRCPAGWDAAQASATVSQGVALLRQGSFEDDGPVIGVLYLQATATVTADRATP